MPLKKWSYNNFLQVNISFEFSRINHKPRVMIWICINTVSLTYGPLQVLPWSNDTTIEKKDSCNRCRQTTDLIQYIHSWNQGQKREFLFPKFGLLKFFFHLPARIIEIVSEYVFFVSKRKMKKHWHTYKQKGKTEKKISWLLILRSTVIRSR